MTLSLRQRIALALFALTTAGAGLLAAALWVGHLELEDALLEDVLNRQLDIYLATGTTPQQAGSATNDLRLYRQRDALPPAIAGLAPGSYRDVRIGDGHYQVRVRDVVAGDRVWLLYDVREFERREQRLLFALAAAVLLTGVLAWAVSAPVSARLLRPLHELVGQLRRLDPGASTTPLTSARPDTDTAEILATLNRLLDEVRSLMQRERAFAAAAAHELRTPLASIRAAAEVLAVSGTSAPVARIERAVVSASRQLDALLALSRGRHLPAAESLNLNVVLPAMAEAFLAEHGAKTVEWHLPTQPIEAPRAVLEIVFTNLLRNALRAAASTVIISADGTHIAIEDDGPGIADALRAQLFEPGTRGTDGGSGMGLYIARTLGERLGWSLELVGREPSYGTRAILRFK